MVDVLEIIKRHEPHGTPQFEHGFRTCRDSILSSVIDAMVEDESRPVPILPCWMTERMMDDYWFFCLELSTGRQLIIHCINKVHQAQDGSLWIDVTMCEKFEPMPSQNMKNVFCSPTERTTATINAAHVVAAYEVADT